jgi:ABC-2 type transport system ATP-binding protein
MVLVIDDVTFGYGSRDVLQGISATLSAGVTALVGVNGAGKTTLMRIASGGLRPRSGRVRIAEFSPYSRGERKEALRRCALMPQELRFPGNFTAIEVVEYLTWMRGAGSKSARHKARESLEFVGLGDRMSSKMGELSGGMVRRVGLAQALAAEPEVLLLDEPSTGLDPEQRRVMVDLLSQLDGCVLLSSHVMEDVTEAAQRVLVLHEGELAFDGDIVALQSRAPVDTPAGRAAEAGFLQIVSTRRAQVAK